ncbi:hypothetical protein LB505_008077 [Fusarium chuoi]|nr:hypothetical protein LB505_008077 [Fusarium chuoi]
MKSVVFKGVKQVALEDRPKPTIQDPTDIIVKVKYTALSSSMFFADINLPEPASSWATSSLALSMKSAPLSPSSSRAMRLSALSP